MDFRLDRQIRTTTLLPCRGRIYSSISLAGVMLSVAILAGCTAVPSREEESATKAPNARAVAIRPRASASAPTLSEGAGRAGDGASTRERTTMVLGNDKVINAKPSATRASAADDAAPISLNFENGDVREIVRNLLGDVLREGFTIDPAVQGTVTIRTAKPIKKSDIVPMLETLLRSVRAVMLRDGDYWRILPETGVNLGATVPRAKLAFSTGYGVTVLPVRYIGAKEMERVLQPFVRPSTPPAIRVDELRNLLFLSGTEREVATMLEIADMFDIDLLSGMSFLLHTLESADVKVVAADWEKIFPAATNPFAGLLRVVPIERMNAILLISPRREAIETAKAWLEKLDVGADAGGGARLYVYQLQYSQAEKLQTILQQAIGARGTTVSSQPTVAPGQTQSTIGAPVSPVAGQPIVTPGNAPPPQPQSPQNPAQTAQQRTGQPNAANNNQISLARNATVVADKDRNALLIVATPSEYSAIESAIKRLDTPPKQIAVEFQLAEVTLTGDLTYGVSSFFRGHPDSSVNRLTSADGLGGIGTTGSGAAATAAYAGFSYVWSRAGGAQVALRALQEKNEARVLAAPTVITLDNQKANFNYGRQISVRTQTASATNNTAPTDSFQYIDTGLNINVTPRVTGSNVQLEIQTQNSTPGDPAPGNPNPPISKTSSQTTVIVSDGDTMMLGGLYLDTTGNGSSGLPLISTIPLIGGLFGSQSWKNTRSELVMLITPRILATAEDTRETVDELRRKLINVERLAPEIGTVRLPADGGRTRSVTTP